MRRLACLPTLVGAADAMISWEEGLSLEHGDEKEEKKKEHTLVHQKISQKKQQRKDERRGKSDHGHQHVRPPGNQAKDGSPPESGGSNIYSVATQPTAT